MKNGNIMDNEQLVQRFYTPGSASAAKLYNLVWQPLEKYFGTLQLSIIPPQAC